MLQAIAKTADRLLSVLAPKVEAEAACIYLGRSCTTGSCNRTCCDYYDSCPANNCETRWIC